MQKIALIYMGGTFGCIGEPLMPMPEQAFLPLLEKIIPPHLQVQCFAAPSIKDSSACTAMDWLQLIQQVQQLQHNNYQHFVIIHGTDTLSYAAATLARFLGHSCHAIITGSQYPLLNIEGNDTREFTDALGNLYLTLEQVLKLPAGIYLAFHQQVFHAQTTLKVHTTELDAFTGIPATQECLTSANHFIVQDEHITQAAQLCVLNLMLQPIPQQQLILQLKNILAAPPQFLVLQGFGTGNIAVNDEILALFEDLYHQKCLTIVSSQVTFGQLDQRYAVSSWIQSVKVLINDCQSHADLYAKTLQMYLKYPTHDQCFEHWNHY
ncbi:MULTISPECIES: asparaginase domain-containing protein [unclassified Acinetobacter]|uniref:asparaginase domain-containing protein n=1 Tax=unclassified Acinetobacter TaxID=196816 RepID=UPI00244B8BB5|nr:MULTISPECIES: asparaginase domain-containing protein [unclassified Acinetobacter]MDH0031097.1 asparaginase domain-containing protein [Acinetobacter sp. GD04021]MDH0886683.1 asparaginase domain-containing protein [Acinetobacter sp. GD03873]MDH1083184.1 asparaginase domain-containing protein [Acinetobacter sp. GD03983]MDH2189303.1 asparaginase domain-containing protein [Acinetobacter sp. GD03645]MDH2202890.1 asparaginase domain-containing protein [Acinetobacter sp. GD03647]